MVCVGDHLIHSSGGRMEVSVKLSTKIMSIVVVAAALASATASQIAKKEIEDQGAKALVAKSQAILDQLEGTRDYVAAQGGLGEYIEQIVSQFPDGQLPDEVKTNILRRVPIFSSIKVGQDQAERSGYKFRVFTPEPRKKENLATSSEMEIYNQFLKDSALKELVDLNEDRVIVYRPVRLVESQGCLHCHGHPNQSPFKNGKDILGYEMENWKDGKLHGVFAITSDMSATKASSSASVQVILVFALGGLIGSLTLAWFILRKPMSELREAVNSMKSSSSHVSATGDEISHAAQNLSTASTQAAAALEQTSASLEELTSMVKMNTDNAQSAKDISTKAMTVAKEGEEQIRVLLDSMGKVSMTAKKVEEITGVMDDIAFQTNLLALNASVEAARAGEQGKGFAVVAEAVRGLAQKSALSAKEISELISQSVHQVQESYDYAIKSEEMLHNILVESEKVAVLNAEIAHASLEQTTGIEQIGKAVHELDKVTQNNAASSEEAAAASVELASQSNQLDELVVSVEGVVEGYHKAA